MIDCKSKVKGDITIKVFGSDGQLKDERHVSNKIVLTGCNVIASLLTTQPLPIPSHIACGYGTNIPLLSNTKLDNEMVCVPLDSPAVRSGNTVMFEATFGPNVPSADQIVIQEGEGAGEPVLTKGLAPITEVGIWCIDPNDSNNKYLLNRATFAVVHKNLDDTVIINWVITVLSDEGVNDIDPTTAILDQAILDVMKVQ